MTIRVLLLTFLVLPLSTGCTLVGGAVGSLTPSTPSVELHAFDQIPIGSRVELTLAGGERVSGRVLGYDPGEGPHPPLPSARPAVGDSVVVVASVSGREAPCVLQGYRRQALAVGCSGMAMEVPYASVRQLSWGGGAVREGHSLRELADVGSLPTWGELHLATGEGDRTIPLDQVVRARRPGRGDHFLLGLALGLAADIFVGYLMWSQMDFPVTFNWESN